MSYKQLSCFAAVLDYCERHETIGYKAPLDLAPRLVRVVRVYKHKIRLDPCSREADPFIADREHAERFYERLPDELYNIVRFRQSGRRRVLHRNVTLDVAQLHCRDPRTHGTGWFDGYERAKVRKGSTFEYNEKGALVTK